MEKELEFLGEIPDIDLQVPVYQVWVLGYDKEGYITDYEALLGEYDDPELAIKCAKEAVLDGCSLLQVTDDVANLLVQVETVVEVEDGELANVGTIFEDGIIL